MTLQSLQLKLGVVAILMALLLGFVGIPYWVSTPSNVGNIILSPRLWPYVLTALTGLTGLGLMLDGFRSNNTENIDMDSVIEDGGDRQALLRLIALGAIMVITMFALPRLGMVWTTMLVLASTSFMFRTRHPKTAIICAVLIPFGLYLFFAHVAGVAIPQGNFVRLP